MTFPNGHCERARAWASLRADGELSELEQALLEAHLERCADCRAFESSLGAIEALLRTEPLEPLPRPISVRRLRSSRSLRLLQAAAAVAVVATAGLGALVADVFHTNAAVTTAPAPRHVSGVSDVPVASFRELRRASLASIESARRPGMHVLFP